MAQKHTNGNGTTQEPPPKMKIDPTLVARAMSRKAKPPAEKDIAFRLPEHPPGVKPAKGSGLAMDEVLQNDAMSWAAGQAMASQFAEGIGFLGYTYLAELAQRPEYRVITETIAEEMTRKWITIQAASGNEDKGERIKELEKAVEDFAVREMFRRSAIGDGFFGRSHLYLDTGDTDDRDELTKPIGNGRDRMSKAKVGKKKPLIAIRSVEAMWTYPATYNSIDPLSEQWYRPETWYVMGKLVHRTRLLTFVRNEVPDILKPAYSFGGLSMSQMAKPYVDNWLRTRQSVADLVHSFTVFALSTDMSQLLRQDGDQLFRRMELFTTLRDNSGLFLRDKDTEEFDNISAPLGTLDALQAASQEHMASVSRIPIVKLLGIQPAGLNASSDGEIRTFYDTIRALQERLFRPKLTTILDFIQLSLWGEIDEEITYQFAPLYTLDEAGEAGVRKTDAETGQILIESGVISQEEERARVARDASTPYEGLDPTDMPELEQEQEEGLVIPGAKPEIQEADEGDKGTGESDKQKPPDAKQQAKAVKTERKEDDTEEGAQDGIIPFDVAADDVTSLAADGAEFHEADHPRRNDGKFGAGGGASAAEKTEGASEQTKGRVREFFSADKVKQAVATGLKMIAENKRDIIATGIIAAVTKAAGSYISPELEDHIRSEVVNLVENAGVAKQMALQAVRNTVNGLIELRKGKGKGKGAEDAAPDDEDGDDDIGMGLENLLKILEGLIEDHPDPAQDAEWKEGDHPRGQPGNAGQFGSGSGGSKNGAKSSKGEQSGPGPAAARAAKVKPAEGFKSHRAHIGYLLRNEGVTTAQVKQITGWPSVSMPAVAKALGLELVRKKEGKVFKYFAVPKKPEEQKQEQKTPEQKPPPPPPPPPSNVLGGMSKQQVEAVAKTVCKKLKFNENKITVREDDKTFVLNGRTFNYAGGAYLFGPRAGEIELYKNQLSEKSAPGVLAHEIEHQKFQSVVDAANVEKMAIMQDPGPLPDPNATEYWARRGGHDAIMKPDGTLRGEYAKKYPIYNELTKVLDSVDVGTFELGDGVSAYSAEYWHGYQSGKGKISRMSAMHETLAEMAAIKFETGKLPDPLGPRHVSWNAPKVPKGAILKARAAWRKLYRSIDNLYDKGGAGKKLGLRP